MISTCIRARHTWLCSCPVYVCVCADIFAFVVLKDGVSDSEEGMVADIQQTVRKHIGGFAVPQIVLVSPASPAP